MMGPFSPIGERVAAAWKNTNYDERELPRIAQEALTEFRAHEKIDFIEAIRWFEAALPAPAQQLHESTFGNPPITVFSDQRFFIEMLCWLEGSTSIHQHGFSGAFQVLTGQSIHCRYHFEETDRINSRLRLGNLIFNEVELLAAGDCRPIRSGPRFIHSTFHLEKPTVTLVVRTMGESEAYPQLSYLNPHIAFDPFAKDPLLDRRTKALEFLLQTKPMAFLKLLEEFVLDSDFEMAYRVLSFSHEQLRDGPLFHQISKLLAGRFGDRVELVLRVLKESERKTQLKQQLEAASKVADKYWLAFEQNVPDLAQARSLFKSKFPDPT